MQGQANHFNRFAKERIAYGMQRYTGETERLVGVLENWLKDHEYLVGDKYSIADIANIGWVNILYYSGVDLESFPNVKAWSERILARPAVQKGMNVPSKYSGGNENYQKRLKEDKEFAESEAKLREQIKAAKEQYGYKYSSP